MLTLEIAPEAIQDIDHIHAYIAKDNPVKADEVKDRLFSAIEKLAQTPFIGHSCEQLLAGCLRWNVGVYGIFYRKTGQKISILRILHGARNLPGLL